jgi:hypothetical protein
LLALPVGLRTKTAGSYLTPEKKTLLMAQVERAKALEKKLGRIIPWLFPHLETPGVTSTAA